MAHAATSVASDDARWGAYQRIADDDGLALAYVAAAHRVPALNDEEKLAAFSVRAAHEPDPFKRKALAAEELPAINSRLAALHATTHYVVEAGDPVVMQRVPPRALPAAVWTDGIGGLSHYDSERKGFAALCLADSGITGGGATLQFNGPTPPMRRCLLSIPQEIAARAIEAEVSRTPTPPLAATFYFTVVDGPARGPAMTATLDHAVVHIFPAAMMGARRPPVADVDVELPQPVL